MVDVEGASKNDIQGSEAGEGRDEEQVALRALPGPWRIAAFGVAVLVSLAHLYFALFADVSELMRNALHFAGFALLCALYYPAAKSRTFAENGAARWVDLVFGLAVAVSAVHLAMSVDAVYDRGVKFVTADWIATAVVILGAIELTRRTTGLIIPILVVLSLTYVSFWGQYLEGVFAFRGLSLETVAFRSIYGDDAIFGTIARISSTYVFLFIIFGAFLLRSGAGDFVIDLSRAVAGRMIGGPGVVAVVASGLTGTISGSAVANTASTGVITIPLMKRAGFPPKFAAAVEASASTGGQLMPPIMGAGAFVMASYTQISYEKIVAVAALPAILYFFTVALFVRVEARRQGIQPETGETPSLLAALKRGGASFIIPIGVLIGLLVYGFTPTYAAVIGIGSVVASSWLTQHPMGPRAVVEALELGARNMIPTAVLLCAVGLVVNVIATAGVGNTFSLMIADWAGGNIFIAIVLIALASLVLGMGLPVTAAYIVLATLSAPALAGMIGDAYVASQMAAGALDASAQAVVMISSPDAAAAMAQPMTQSEALSFVNGLPIEIRAALRDIAVPAATATAAILSAHMIIFWLSQDSNVTPPVCLAAFTAAAIAKSPAMATGFTSWKIAKGLYIVPLLFAYTPFLSGDWAQAFEIFCFALIGIYGIIAGLEGWMERKLTLPARVVAPIAGVACVWPADLVVDLIGAAVVIALLVLNVRGAPLVTARSSRTAAA